MADLVIDFGEWQEFVERLSSADTSFKKDLEQFIEALGIEFLDIIQDEIINNENFDTGALINSFTKSEKGNIWVLGNSSYSITLEIGSELDYAGFVNDGHWTNNKGELGRWIPGTWNGDRFEYTPNAKTGMYLKQQWVEGSHYFDTALKIMEKLIPKYVEKWLDNWIQAYLAKFLGG